MRIRFTPNQRLAIRQNHALQQRRPGTPAGRQNEHWHCCRRPIDLRPSVAQGLKPAFERTQPTWPRCLPRPPRPTIGLQNGQSIPDDSFPHAHNATPRMAGRITAR